MTTARLHTLTLSPVGTCTGEVVGLSVNIVVVGSTGELYLQVFNWGDTQESIGEHAHALALVDIGLQGIDRC